MRASIFIFSAIILTAEILLATPGRGQGNEQRIISLSVKNTPIQKVFASIETKADVVIMYENTGVLKNEKVSIRASNRKVADILDELLKGKSLKWSIRENVIRVEAAEPEKSPHEGEPVQGQPVVADAQTPPPVDISGKVTGSDGKPLQGASVVVKGTRNATTTDANGMFGLKGVDENAELEISYAEHQSQTVSINKRQFITISLTAADKGLEDVVIKGYYNTSKLLNTGSVSTITAKDISKQPVGNPLAALYGSIPGLEITQSSGAPGQMFTMRLRGLNSIANGNDPLVIVDGIIFPSGSFSQVQTTNIGRESLLNSINPADIQEITVLKDADATAIYGSRGANGVILISTKRGQAGKTKVDLNVYRSAGKVGRKIDLMNTQQYLEMRREALQNDGRVPNANEHDLNGNWDTTRYTDWQDVFVGGTAQTTDAQLRVSGGSDRTQFIIGGGYRKEGTVFPGDYFDQRISMQAGINHQSNDGRLTISFNGNYAANNNKMPQDNFAALINLQPNAPALYNDDGSINWNFNAGVDNPISFTKKMDRNLTNNLITNLSASYRIYKGLSLKANFGYNKIDIKESRLTPQSAFSPLITANRRDNNTNNVERTSWIAEPQLTYNSKLWSGDLNILIGATFQEDKSEALLLYASGFDSDNLLENLRSAPSVTVSNYANTEYRYQALFGRVGYQWRERYIINLTGRRDGSSRFGPNKRFGSFGAVGAAWIFSNEGFIKKGLSVLSVGKLRGSIGVTGNDQFADYEFLSTYAPFNFNYQDMGLGLVPQRHTNPDYRWEKVTKVELGLELGFFKNRLNLEVNAYRNRTGNQLVGYALNEFTGFPSVRANLPAVVENKGLEMTINITNIQTTNWIWRTSFNISIPRNKLVEYPDLDNSTYNETYEIGKSLSVRKFYQYAGINPQTGEFTFKDLNDDGVMNSTFDRYFLDAGVKYFGGIQSQLSYKGITFSILANFRKAISPLYYFSATPGAFASRNQPVAILDRWQKPGDDATLMSKFTTQVSNSWINRYAASDAAYGKVSYMRIRNMELSWQMPEKWLHGGINMQMCRVYLQCQNPFTFSGYRGIDPEVGSALQVAPLRVFAGGVQITF